jgi:hypothetical protein
MATNIPSPEVAAEREWLLTELSKVRLLTAAAHRTGGRPMEGAALRRLLATEAKEAAIVHRIREIDGTLGQPWDAL